MALDEKILIVDDDPANVKLLAAKLGESNYTVIRAFNGEEALLKVETERPALVLLDVMMPNMNGFEVAAQIKNCPDTSDIPVLLVTALDGPDNKAKGLEAGADDFLNKPVHTAELKARVRSLLRMKRYSDQLKARAVANGAVFTPAGEDGAFSELRLPNLLIVEDSLTDAKLIKSLLNNVACNIHIAHSGEEALSICHSSKVDIMILDMLLPGLDGYEVVKQVKENASTQSIQIIVVTSLQDMESKVKGFEFGVDDYLVKPINFNEFRARVNSLIKKKAFHDRLMGNFEMAVQAAITDRLTGAYNNAYFQYYLKNELKRAERHAYSVSLLMLDIDDFKLVNDRHGHLAGDAILKEIAQRVRQTIREIDMLARYGGDEFAIVLPYTHGDSAVAMAERIRSVIEGCSVSADDPVVLNLSVSAGVAEFCPGIDTAHDLIQKADKALYSAKFAGKNKVCSAAEPLCAPSVTNEGTVECR